MAETYEDAAALREALRVFARRTEDVASMHGLTTRTYTLLLMIKTGRELQERSTPDELEQRLQLAKSTVAELLQRTEKQGLTRRELHPHRRGAIALKLTKKGERLLRRVFDDLGSQREHLRRILAG